MQHMAKWSKMGVFWGIWGTLGKHQKLTKNGWFWGLSGGRFWREAQKGVKILTKYEHKLKIADLGLGRGLGPVLGYFGVFSGVWPEGGKNGSK